MPAQYGKSAGVARTIKNVGTQATAGATKKAQSTAIGSKQLAKSNSKSSPLMPVKSRKATVHPGSKAGLNDQKIVRLQRNGTGYANPAVQKARYKTDNKIVTPTQQKTMRLNLKRKTTKSFDSRVLKSQNNSISKLLAKLDGK